VGGDGQLRGIGGGRETFFHGQTPGPEVRADLLTGLTPLFVVAVTDLAMH